ncbi:MAG: DNA adenine methylase [Ruminococcus flavefaciens]|nr:DNA adenine methylase [Ruminococcus flavefaciens]
MKSFIPWVGGKQLLAKKIVSMFPDDFDRYIEVFGGGGSVMFYRENYAPLEVYNDFNSDLVNLFRCAKYHRAELQREISGYFNSREIFDEIKAKMEISGFTDIQRAAMFFMIAKISYGSNMKTFGGRKRNISPDCLEETERRLRNVVIEKMDFENLIKKYDSPDALFYCDPPYNKTERYYDEKFNKKDHERLKAVLSQIKGHFILSYNDDEHIRNLYKDYEIIDTERHNNLSGGYYREIIIKNF